MNVGIGDGEFDLSALISPVSIVENKPEPIEKQENQTQENTTEPTRQANILRMEEQPFTVPDTISVKQNTQKSRPVGEFLISKFDKGTGSTPRVSNDDDSGGGSSVGEPIKSNSKENNDIDEGPALKPPVKIVRTGGAIMSKMISLPKPVYSEAAKAIGAGGAVSVEILVDEKGNVTSAKAVSGHSLLKASAESAARKAKFTPTYLSGQPVKATGLIVYNFVKN
jgi:TonB family protein